MADLLAIYLETLRRCAPEPLVRAAMPDDAPRTVVAIGKCAGPLLDGAAAVYGIQHAFVALPAGYPAPKSRATVVAGGHPDLIPESFDAGRRLAEFVDRHDEILFLVSGGGSACADLPLSPWFHERDLIEVNARLLASGLPIGTMNTVRRHLSAIKGGRLAARVRGRSVTLIYSDVASGALADVASGPTLPDITTKADAIRILQSLGGCDRIVTTLRDGSVPETVAEIANATAFLIADNETLTATAREIAREMAVHAVPWPGQIETSVADAAEAFAARASELAGGEVLIAGGEPTVVKQGNGRGGRCSELAVRFAIAAAARGLHGVSALFGSTDGVDGNSGAAGILLPGVPRDLETGRIDAALASSDSFPIAAQLGEPIMIAPSGNNLRDLFLLARG
jgi:hydroxypyruvate reductase